MLSLSLALGACGGGSGDGGGTGGNDYTPGTGTGTALLTWSAPAEREDGSAIAVNEISGYRIHFGPASDPDNFVIEVSGGGQSQYSITGLDPDTYSFAVSAVDGAGRESGFSNSMTKVIAN